MTGTRTLLAFILVLASASVCLAEEEFVRQWRQELGAGPVDEIDGKTSAGAMLSWVSNDHHPWELSIGYIDARSNANGLDTPRVFSVSATRRFTWRRWFWVNGIAFVDGQSDALSSFYQFVNGPGWQGDRVTISFRHMSNANSRGDNRGENVLILAWRF